MAGEIKNQQIETSISKRHRYASKKVNIALLGAAVLLTVAVLGAIPASRHVINGYIGVSSPQKTGSCSGNSELTARYNKIVRQNGVAGLAPIAKEIQGLPRHTSDPTCVYMMMIADYGSNSVSGEQKNYENLRLLKANGQDVSAKVDDGIDREAVYGLIRQHITEGAEKSYGQG